MLNNGSLSSAHCQSRRAAFRPGRRHQALAEQSKLLFAVHALWQECNTTDDDILVAMFSCYGMTAIHPFINANGRTALDFAQFLLMHRWGSRMAPFDLPKDAHDRFGTFFRALEPPCDGSDDQLLRFEQWLSLRFERTSVAALADVVPLVDARDCLKAHLRLA